MERRDEELIRQFLDHDDELRALYQEHQELKQKLENFRTKIYLSTEEELEKRRIQKLKLAHKDKMMELLHRNVQHEAH
jgi:formyltetrahydrofolate synthetase